MSPNYPIRNPKALQVDLIAYPVGEKKDSYSIACWFEYNAITEETKASFRVVKNFYSQDPETLFFGTYKECHEYISELIKDI